MPLEDWSDSTLIVELNDEPMFSDDFDALMRRVESTDDDTPGLTAHVRVHGLDDFADSHSWSDLLEGSSAGPGAFRRCVPEAQPARSILSRRWAQLNRGCPSIRRWGPGGKHALPTSPRSLNLPPRSALPKGGHLDD